VAYGMGIGGFRETLLHQGLGLARRLGVQPGMDYFSSHMWYIENQTRYLSKPPFPFHNLISYSFSVLLMSSLAPIPQNTVHIKINIQGISLSLSLSLSLSSSLRTT